MDTSRERDKSTELSQTMSDANKMRFTPFVIETNIHYCWDEKTSMVHRVTNNL
jgi:hypothetical protein